MSRLACLLLLSLVGTTEAQAAEAVPALVDTVRQARLAQGFEARMSLAVIQPDGTRALPVRLAVIGQVGTDRQRLLIRGIAPDTVRQRWVMAERMADGRIQAFEYESGQSGETAIDPQQRLYHSGLVVWDLFAPWWSWPGQTLGAPRQVAGRECRQLRSVPDAAAGGVAEVLSCVNETARLALSTELFDRRHRPLRTLTVKQMVRKESGAMTAKKLIVTEADRTVTEIEVYAGDEHYEIAPDTFARLDARAADGKRR
jgi:hypothetical protein